MAAPKITSTDIDLDAISPENMTEMRAAFPDRADEELARYLIARNNDFDKAKAMLESALAWRAKNLPVMKADCGSEFTSGKICTRGIDKEGRPLLIYTAKLNFHGTRDLDQAGKTLIWWTEYTIRQLPPHLSKYTILLNRCGSTRENSDLDMAKHFAQVLQDAYPERVKTIIIYPTDILFYTLWNIGKWFLDPVTRNKVKPMLQFRGVEEFVDRSQIPRDMGGDHDFTFDPESYPELWEPPAADGTATAAADSTTSEK
jgi:hypothetical protein